MTTSMLISSALIWVLFFWLYRDYRLERFRQNLFELRDELFAFAEEGDISFDDPAYGMLRSTINGTIRHGHRLSIVDLVSMRMFVPNYSRGGEAYGTKFNRFCEELDEPTRKSMKRFQASLHMEIIEQVILTSALCVFTVVVAGVWIALVTMKDLMVISLNRLLNNSRISKLLLNLDSAAFSRILPN